MVNSIMDSHNLAYPYKIHAYIPHLFSVTELRSKKRSDVAKLPSIESISKSLLYQYMRNIVSETFGEMMGQPKDIHIILKNTMPVYSAFVTFVPMRNSKTEYGRYIDELLMSGGTRLYHSGTRYWNVLLAKKRKDKKKRKEVVKSHSVVSMQVPVLKRNRRRIADELSEESSRPRPSPLSSALTEPLDIDRHINTITLDDKYTMKPSCFSDSDDNGVELIVNEISHLRFEDDTKLLKRRKLNYD